MKKATKNTEVAKPVGRGFQPRRKGNSRIAERGDVLAASAAANLSAKSQSATDEAKADKKNAITNSQFHSNTTNL